ncbi:hypothetical protein HY732_03635 [Candidatus Uhrbacteria bacterium]|nr:hypothetical protein [Candidatus Uhrbacteria bacterium]
MMDAHPVWRANHHGDHPAQGSGGVQRERRQPDHRAELACARLREPDQRPRLASTGCRKKGGNDLHPVARSTPKHKGVGQQERHKSCTILQAAGLELRSKSRRSMTA